MHWSDSSASRGGGLATPLLESANAMSAGGNAGLIDDALINDAPGESWLERTLLPDLNFDQLRDEREEAANADRSAYLVAKRALDLFVSGSALLMCWPLLLLIAWAVRRDSPGPVMFIHKRPGLNGRLFRIYKFRTMTMDASRQFRHLTPEQRREFASYGKICTDPRVTTTGYWLRKFSLDELPQLWNVFRGDMSLIGPRPYLRSQLKNMPVLRESILTVPPGLTGLWQVSGRNELTFEERLRLDLRYTRERSFWFDLWILARTPWIMITSRGAF